VLGLVIVAGREGWGGGWRRKGGREKKEGMLGLVCCHYLLSVSLNIKCVVDSKSVNLNFKKKLHSLWVLNLYPHYFSTWASSFNA